ncbi:MAG TPA: hypothetical protein VGQ49_16760 [Bryobacteraceae bacterium]|jgi:hypothetical protein|nr:hypothetical protein [Bryobacteraceae bacterium]
MKNTISARKGHAKEIDQELHQNHGGRPGQANEPKTITIRTQYFREGIEVGVADTGQLFYLASTVGLIGEVMLEIWLGERNFSESLDAPPVKTFEKWFCLERKIGKDEIGAATLTRLIGGGEPK